MKSSLKYLILFIILAFPGLSLADNEKAHKILHMPPNKIADFIAHTGGKKRVVMIYTSWCPACRKIIPKIMDIERIKSGSVIAVSEDDDHVQFVKYINRYPQVPFIIFLSRPTKNITLKSMLQAKMGVNPWEGYPHFILLDEENIMVGQGNYTAEDIADFLLGTEIQEK